MLHLLHANTNVQAGIFARCSSGKKNIVFYRNKTGNVSHTGEKPWPLANLLIGFEVPSLVPQKTLVDFQPSLGQAPQRILAHPFELLGRCC
jgi:hypothetical protein